MNNTTESKQITEADVVAFLSAKAKELNRLTNNHYASVDMSVTETTYNNMPSRSVRCTAYVDGCTTHKACNSLDTAMGLIVAEMAPAARVEALRAEAAKLLAEAESLSPTALPDTQDDKTSRHLMTSQPIGVE